MANGIASSRTSFERKEASGIEASAIWSAETDEVTEKQHESGFIYYEIKSEKFAGRAYIIRQLADGSWYFVGDERTKKVLVAKVEAFIASQKLALAAQAEKAAAFVELKRRYDMREQTKVDHCAWCGDAPNAHGSHGICAMHAKRLKEQAKACKEARQEAERIVAAPTPVREFRVPVVNNSYAGYIRAKVAENNKHEAFNALCAKFQEEKKQDAKESSKLAKKSVQTERCLA